MDLVQNLTTLLVILFDTPFFTVMYLILFIWMVRKRKLAAFSKQVVFCYVAWTLQRCCWMYVESSKFNVFLENPAQMRQHFWRVLCAAFFLLVSADYTPIIVWSVYIASLPFILSYIFSHFFKESLLIAFFSLFLSRGFIGNNLSIFIRHRHGQRTHYPHRIPLVKFHRICCCCTFQGVCLN